MFTPFLKKQIAQHIFKDDQQHSPRLSLDQHKKYQSKPEFSDCWTFNFLRGLFYELGFNCQQDYKLSIKEYLKGCECLDAFCFYRLAEIYSDPKNRFGIQVDPEISLFYYFISSALIDYQYASNFIVDYDKNFLFYFSDEEGAQKFCEDQLHKHGHLLPQPVDFNSALISHFFLFKYSENQGGEAQVKYENLLNFYFQIFSRVDKPDPCFLLLIIRLFCMQTHNKDKKVKLFIELIQLSGKQTFEQTCDALRKQFLFTTQLSEDNEMYFRQRECFFEMFFIYRHCFDKTYSHVKQASTTQLNLQDITMHKAIGEKLYQICKMLYIGNAVIESQLHNVLLIRVRSKMMQAGIDTTASIEQAAIVIEMELQIKKSRQCLYAQPMYILAKIKKELKEQVDNSKSNRIIQLFKQMYNESEFYGKFIALYYIGRIFQIFQNNLTIAFKYFQEALQIYETNQVLFSSSRTTFYYIYYQKAFKHIDYIQNNQLFQDQVENYKNTRKSKLNIQLDSQQKQQNNNMILNQQLLNDDNDNSIDIKKKKDKSIKMVIKENVEEEEEKKEDKVEIDMQQKKGRQLRRSFTQDAKLLISQKAAQDIVENQYKMRYINYEDQIETGEFICKGDLGTTCHGILTHKIQIQEKNKQQQLQQKKKTLTTMQNKMLESNQEEVILKFIIFDAIFQKRNLIVALGKLRLLKKFQKLLQPIGFSGVQIGQSSFQIIIIYPKLQYNLQGLILQKKMPTMKEKLKVALQIAYSLKDLHTHGLSHGDLKPTNILSDSNLRICISDWEFSQFLDKPKGKNVQELDEQEVEPDGEEPLQQLGYVAPEMVEEDFLQDQTQNNTLGRNKNTQQSKKQEKTKKGRRGPYCDIWSFGMILNFIFFKQDASDLEFLSEQLLYFGSNIEIQNYKVGSDLFFDKIKQLIETMVKFKPSERVNIHIVCEILEKLMKRQLPQQSKMVSQELLDQIDKNPDEFDRIARILQKNYLKKKKKKNKQ